LVLDREVEVHMLDHICWIDCIKTDPSTYIFYQ